MRTSLTLSKTLRSASGRPGRKAATAVSGAESIEALRARGVLVVTKAQMAVALQVTYRCVTKMMSRGEIPFFRVGGKHVRIRVEEALKRMEARAEVAR